MGGVEVAVVEGACDVSDGVSAVADEHAATTIESTTTATRAGVLSMSEGYG